LVDLLGSRSSVCAVITTTMKAMDASEGKKNSNNKLMAANSFYDDPGTNAHFLTHQARVVA
jgi:cellulase/cellobiase CelA1